MRAPSREHVGQSSEGRQGAEALHVDQMQRFLAAARDVSKLARLYEVGFLAGLRLGELTGRQLDDIVGAASGKRKLRVERQFTRFEPLVATACLSRAAYRSAGRSSRGGRPLSPASPPVEPPPAAPAGSGRAGAGRP